MRISDWSSDVCSSDLGEWLKSGEALLGVVGNGGVKGDAFVDEAALSRLAVGQPVSFRAALPELPIVQCRVSGIDRPDRKSVESGKSVSVRGGPGGPRIIHNKNLKYMTPDNHDP